MLKDAVCFVQAVLGELLPAKSAMHAEGTAVVLQLLFIQHQKRRTLQG
jgi:hypothetical protein